MSRVVDGIVDVEDLIVLAEHLFEEFLPVESGLIGCMWESVSSKW